MDGDQADRAGIAHCAKPLDDPGWLQAEAVVGQGFAQHDLAFRGAAFLAARHQPFCLGPAIRWDDAAATIDAKDAAGSLRQSPDGAAFVAVRSAWRQAGKYALTGSQRRLAARFCCHEYRRRRTRGGVPVRRSGDRVAVRVGAGDDDNGGVCQIRGRRTPARGLGAAWGGADWGHAPHMRVPRHDRQHPWCFLRHTVARTHLGGVQGL